MAASTGACWEELLRWACGASHGGAAFQGVLPGTAMLVIVSYLGFDPFAMLILKGANRNKLPLSPHSLGTGHADPRFGSWVRWAGWRHSADLNPGYHRNNS